MLASPSATSEYLTQLHKGDVENYANKGTLTLKSCDTGKSVLLSRIIQCFKRNSNFLISKGACLSNEISFNTVIFASKKF